MALSEGGLAVIADLHLEQGDPIRLLVFPGHGPAFTPARGVGGMAALPWWMP